ALDGAVLEHAHDHLAPQVGPHEGERPAVNPPIPPGGVAAGSAAESGHRLQPSRVQAGHPLGRTSGEPPSRIQIWSTPLMFLFTRSCRSTPYFASSSSSNMASSKVFEHSRPMLRANRRAGLPALRTVITGGTDDWQLIPTRPSFSAPPATASAYAIV